MLINIDETRNEIVQVLKNMGFRDAEKGLQSSYRSTSYRKFN